MGFISSTCGSESVSSTLACQTATTTLEQHKNCEQNSGFVAPGLLLWDKALSQITPLHVSRFAYIEGSLGASLYDGVFHPFLKDPTPAINRYRTTTCGDQQILTAVTLFPCYVK
jgi:hypothetical protein